MAVMADAFPGMQNYIKYDNLTARAALKFYGLDTSWEKPELDDGIPARQFELHVYKGYPNLLKTMKKQVEKYQDSVDVYEQDDSFALLSDNRAHLQSIKNMLLVEISGGRRSM